MPIETDTTALATPTADPRSSARGTIIAGIVVVILLSGVCLGLIFQSGAYGPSTWLPLMIGVGVFALMLAWAGPAVSTGRFQKILLAVFSLQVVWTAASILWADSLANAWEETNRTLFYAVALVLVFVAVRWAGPVGLGLLAASLAAVAGAVAVFLLITLAMTPDPENLFQGGRLQYPITYFNGLASLLMIGFWLALGLANGSRSAPNPKTDEAPADTGDEQADEEAAQSRVEALRQSRAARRKLAGFPRWTQPLFLLLAVVLLETAILPQSRGAFWAFFLVIPFFVLLSANRFRALVDLALVIIPVVLFWSSINGTYAALSANELGRPALDDTLLAIGYSAAIVLGLWVITWIIERWIAPLRRRVVVWVSAGLAALAILAAAGGIVYADMRTGGLDDYLGDRWEEFTSDRVGNVSSTSRFAAVGLNGRLTMWKTAAQAGAEDLALGSGAQNFEYYWYQHRTSELDIRQPHSQPMQLFAELGVAGLLLWIALILATLVRAAIVRFRCSALTGQAVVAAIMTAAISWFIHSSADWLWQLAGVSLPAMLLLGGLIAADKDPASPAASVASPSKSKRPRLSLILRAAAALVAVMMLASATFPYVSLRYSDVAAGAPDLERMTSSARTAALLDPTSVLPFSVRANAHRVAASETPMGSLERLRQLRLAATAWEEALEREPDSWVCNYQAAQAFVAARDAALAAGATFAEELEDQARIYLAEARRLNPLSSQVDTLERLLSTGG